MFSLFKSAPASSRCKWCRRPSGYDAIPSLCDVCGKRAAAIDRMPGSNEVYPERGLFMRDAELLGEFAAHIRDVKRRAGTADVIRNEVMAAVVDLDTRKEELRRKAVDAIKRGDFAEGKRLEAEANRLHEEGSQALQLTKVAQE